MDKKNPDEELIVEQIKGQIKGLNTARVLVWGIGYDNDDTALMLRRVLCERIEDLETLLKHYYDAQRCQEALKAKIATKV